MQHNARTAHASTTVPATKAPASTAVQAGVVPIPASRLEGASLPRAALRRPANSSGQSLSPIDPGSRPLLLCFSHLRWDFVWQRPQHLLSRAAQTHRVIVFEEPVIGQGEPRLAVENRPGGIMLAVPHLPQGLAERAANAALRKLLDGLLAAQGQPAVLWYYSPMMMAFSSHVRAPVRVYDCMDELSAFKNAPQLLPSLERRLFARADLVFTGGRSLYEAKKGKHHSVHAFPSSIEVKHFAAARVGGLAEPSDQKEIPRPRLGFFGVVDERMDVDLVGQVAAMRPDWHFVMLGPVVKIDPASLPRNTNIHWLGSKAYKDLPAYIGGWDVGFMPFAINEATRYISPTKTPEFLAAGVPVVSTPITDVVHPWGDDGMVEIAADAEGLVRKIEAVMARSREPWLSKVDRRLSTMSWDRTWGSMLRLIQAVETKKERSDVRTGTALTGMAQGAAHV